MNDLMELKVWLEQNIDDQDAKYMICKYQYCAIEYCVFDM